MIVFVLIVLPWIVVALGSIFIPNPPVPEITYGEFPFRLEYKINGEIVVVEDTVICEYDGVGWNEGMGKFRKWKSYLASSGEEGVLVATDGSRKVYFYVGDAEYYMGDEKYPEQRPLTPRVYMKKTDNTDTVILTPEQLLEKYNIELISWELSEPIVNSFK